jgi:hypothetical protein
MLPELRTVDQLGADLWPSWDEKRRRRWIYRQTEEHGLPAIRLGRSLIFETAAVKAWLDAQTTNRGENDGPRKSDGPPLGDGPLEP